MADPGVTPHARILILDEEQAPVAALCRMLTTEGYEVTAVSSGSAALAALRAAVADPAARFEVLIFDLKRPAKDGLTLLQAAREIDAELEAIIMTDPGHLDSAMQALPGAALAHISKPFKLNTLVAGLARAQQFRRLRLENRALAEQIGQRNGQLEKANLELLRADQALEAFVHSVSHDLRQPLNGVIGFSDLLITEKPGSLNPAQKEYVGEILEGGKRLLRLTDELLRVSRLRQRPLRKETVNTEGLVSEILRALRNAEPERAIEVHVGALPEASADPALLRQIFVNLLANAFKFTRRTPHPRVEITADQDAHGRTYRIRDNGAGFEMAQAHRLFTIFQRLHPESEFEGSGVGLSIVQRIIERHGGTISAEGAVGAGATFTFTLPM